LKDDNGSGSGSNHDVDGIDSSDSSKLKWRNEEFWIRAKRVLPQIALSILKVEGLRKQMAFGMDRMMPVVDDSAVSMCLALNPLGVG
jgi:hypothetical protein